MVSICLPHMVIWMYFLINFLTRTRKHFILWIEKKKLTLCRMCIKNALEAVPKYTLVTFSRNTEVTLICKRLKLADIFIHILEKKVFFLFYFFCKNAGFLWTKYFQPFSGRFSEVILIRKREMLSASFHIIFVKIISIINIIRFLLHGIRKRKWQNSFRLCL